MASPVGHRDGRDRGGDYAYYPTFAALAGRVAAHETGIGELDAIVAEVEAAGTLPARGWTVHVDVPAPRSGFEARRAYVYLPPAWFAVPRPALPVILLLHGDPGGPENWTRSGQADVAADAFAADHGGQAPILVMPDVGGVDQVDTECVDSRRGRVETYLMDDVLAFAADRFGAATGPGTVAVAGLSSGGTCAAILALRHPDQIRVFGDYSGVGQPTLDRPEDGASRRPQAGSRWEATTAAPARASSPWPTLPGRPG